MVGIGLMVVVGNIGLLYKNDYKEVYSMYNGPKLYDRYSTKEERLEAWKQKRLEYDIWRRTNEAQEFIEKRRASQFGMCFICITRLGVSLHIDHVFPLYLGGTNSRNNLCLTHGECNMRKGTKVYMTYREACVRRKLFKLFARAVGYYEDVDAGKTRPMGRRTKQAVQAYDKYFPERNHQKTATKLGHVAVVVLF